MHKGETSQKKAINLKHNAIRVCIFLLFFLVGIPSIMILSVKNKVCVGGGGEEWGREGLLNRQNLLIVTKVICRQSLIVYSVLTLT